MTLGEQQNLNFIMQSETSDLRAKMGIGLSRRRASALEIQELFSALQQLVPRNAQVRSPSEVSNGKVKNLSTDNSSADGSEDSISMKHSQSKSSLQEKLGLLFECSAANTTIGEQRNSSETETRNSNFQQEKKFVPDDLEMDVNRDSEKVRSICLEKKHTGIQEWKRREAESTSSAPEEEEDKGSVLKPALFKGRAKEFHEIRTEGRISSLSNGKHDKFLPSFDMVHNLGPSHNDLAPPVGHNRLVNRRATFALGSSLSMSSKPSESEESISGKVKDLLILPKGASNVKRSLSKTLADFGAASSNKLSKINVFKKRKPTNKQVKEKPVQASKSSERSDSSPSTKGSSIASVTSLSNQHVKQKNEKQSKKITTTSHFCELGDFMEHKPLYHETSIPKSDSLYSTTSNSENFKEHVNQRLHMWVEKATALSNRDSDSEFDQTSLDDVSCCSKEEFTSFISYKPKRAEKKMDVISSSEKGNRNKYEEDGSQVITHHNDQIERKFDDIDKEILQNDKTGNNREDQHECNCRFCPVLSGTASTVTEKKQLFIDVGTMTEQVSSTEKEPETVRMLKYVRTEHKKPLKHIKTSETSLFYGYPNQEPMNGGIREVTLLYVDDPRSTKLYNESFKKRSSPLPYSVNTAQFFTNQIKTKKAFKGSRKDNLMRVKDKRYLSMPCLFPLQSNSPNISKSNPDLSFASRSSEEADYWENTSLKSLKKGCKKDKELMYKEVNKEKHIVNEKTHHEDISSDKLTKESSISVSSAKKSPVPENTAALVSSMDKAMETFL